MMQILKKRLSEDLNLTRERDRSQGSSLSLSLTHTPNTIWHGQKCKGRLEKGPFFLHLYRCWWITCASAAFVYWRKEFLNRFDKGNLLVLETRQVCFMLLCSATLWPYKHITHPGSEGMVLIPKDEVHRVRQMFFICFIFCRFSIGSKMLPGSSLPMQH